MSEQSLGPIETSLSPLERFEEFLQSRSGRMTQQRRVLVEHVFKRHEHFDADDLTAEISQLEEGKRIGKATVYRTLSELVDAGLLRQMELGGRKIYEHDYGYPQHDHMFCVKCEKLIEFQSEEIKRILQEVAGEHQFRVTGRRFIVNGICRECQTARRRQHRPLDRI